LLVQKSIPDRRRASVGGEDNQHAAIQRREHVIRVVMIVKERIS
jgi:hypothetical protein